MDENLQNQINEILQKLKNIEQNVMYISELILEANTQQNQNKKNAESEAIEKITLPVLSNSEVIDDEVERDVINIFNPETNQNDVNKQSIITNTRKNKQKIIVL